MKTTLVAGALVAWVALGCTSSESPNNGAGGTPGAGGSGGTTSTGGTPGAGGTPGTGGTTTPMGGTPGTGGDTSTGGTPGTGGTTTPTGGTGGTTSTGGTGGVGGATSTGGTGGVGGATPTGGTPGTGGAGVPGDYKGRPLGGTPQAIPGMIQIENYDTGGEGVAYHDAQVVNHGQLCGVTRTDLIDLNCTGQAGSPTDKNQDMGCANTTNEAYLGYIATGDWLNYTVTVKETGTYVVSTHAGVAGNTKLQLTFTTTVKTAAFTLPNTGGCGVEAYHVWQTQKNLTTIALTAGTYVMRLDFVAANLNLDWVALTKM